MIAWQIEVDPDDGWREYRAKIGEIDFHIMRSTNAGFGLSAYRRLTDGRNESLSEHGRGIMWLRTLKRCKAHADQLLDKHNGGPNNVQRLPN
jgi:hypothetical protein